MTAAADADTDGKRPFGLTVVSVAVGFWGLLWVLVGVGEPTTGGTGALAVGLGAVLLAAGLFLRLRYALPAGLVALGGGVVWYLGDALAGSRPALAGALGAAVAALYLYHRRPYFR